LIRINLDSMLINIGRRRNPRLKKYDCSIN
jgi:hypothetical protein